MHKELNNQVVEVKKEIDNINDRQDALKSEKNLLEVEEQDLITSIKMKEQNERDRLRPEIVKFEEMIKQMQLQIEEGGKSIAKEDEKNQELTGKIEELESVQGSLKEKYDARQVDFLKEKDEPVRLGKSNENLRIAVEHLRGDLESLNREIESFEKRREAED
jgi:chromosome segregation ATPase